MWKVNRRKWSSGLRLDVFYGRQTDSVRIKLFKLRLQLRTGLFIRTCLNYNFRCCSRSESIWLGSSCIKPKAKLVELYFTLFGLINSNFMPRLYHWIFSYHREVIKKSCSNSMANNIVNVVVSADEWILRRWMENPIGTTEWRVVVGSRFRGHSLNYLERK